MSVAPATRDGRVKILFMQSQTFFGADSAIHGQIMRHLDRSAFDVHVAVNAGDDREPSPSLNALSKIPDLAIRPTNFGTTVTARSKRQILLDTARSGVPALASLGGLVAYARKHRIDVVHCTEKPRDAFYGLLLARAIGARCLIHIHVKAEDWISPLVRWAMHRADVLVGVSDFVADSIVQLGYPAHKTRSVLNCLDLEQWDGRADPAKIRREFGVPDDVPLMAIVSRLFSWKGHRDLIRALGRVKERVPRFRLLVVGEDDPRANPGGGSFSAELRELTAELGLEEHVTFTGFRKDVPDVMAACDVYTMPSFEEPFGMVYLEAMAFSKPVIALDNGGAREIVQHGVTGLLSLPGDVERLADNIVTLLQDPELGRRMGAAGNARLKERFAAPRMARDVEQVYLELVGKPAFAPGRA